MTQPNDAETDSRPSEAVWTFRGYQMRPAEFNTAMVHFYRGEIQRANTWRNRLDTTTNWAVVATGAAISFALSNPANHYGVIILNTLLVTLFLWIEARRYRYYELWAYRVRLMETDFFGSMLVPPFAPSPDWAESLADSLLKPEFPISMWEAFGRRFRRNYMYIFLILAAAWALKNFIHPVPAVSLDEFYSRAAIGPIPGGVVLAVGLIYNGALFAIGLLTAGLHQASGEVLPKWSEFPGLNFLWRWMQTQDSSTTHTSDKERAWQRPGRKRQQLLALIISSKNTQIADRIMKDMRRGVTALHGRGMFAKQERDVLLVAVTITEMPQMKALVGAEDPNAFVIVAPAQEILGRGFQPLDG
ncbi:MAG TPA: DUF2270 domain-containing protein [Anaerolineales bacterium]|nr:DUF2270 domain-containing protein [Anaerolineales bacterium]